MKIDELNKKIAEKHQETGGTFHENAMAYMLAGLAH